ncbi:hypothetical protein L9F63_015116, partial [Diploptera punctata]
VSPSLSPSTPKGADGSPSLNPSIWVIITYITNFTNSTTSLIINPDILWGIPRAGRYAVGGQGIVLSPRNLRGLVLDGHFLPSETCISSVETSALVTLKQFSTSRTGRLPGIRLMLHPPIFIHSFVTQSEVYDMSASDNPEKRTHTLGLRQTGLRFQVQESNRKDKRFTLNKIATYKLQHLALNIFENELYQEQLQFQTSERWSTADIEQNCVSDSPLCEQFIA